MLGRFLLSGAILLLSLVLLPACTNDRKTESKGTKPLPKDEAPPSPKPAGKSG